MNLPPPKPEWADHAAVWIGFPSHPDLWKSDLEPARDEVVAFARAVDCGGKGERVLLVASDEDSASAARARAGDFADIIVQSFGDIWLRDTAAIIRGDGVAADFGFNGWGGKYDLSGDSDVGARLAANRGQRVERLDWILEGGAIDGDGTGLVVTTEQCLLNANRNGAMARSDIETRLARDLGYAEVLWLGDGLLNDHTDGHVDNLARFVAPRTLALPEASKGDPNRDIYRNAANRAAQFGVTVMHVPSPGRVLRDGEIVPASYMNFYIGNASVVVPLYGADNDQAAVSAIAALFPGRQTVGLSADHILTGGGSFHCISQQIPA